MYETSNGLAKMPYVRDTRRGIGLDDFILVFKDIVNKTQDEVTGEAFYDRVGIGSYPCDFHSMNTCTLPQFLFKTT